MARGSIRRITTKKHGDRRWEVRLSGVDRTGRRRQFRRHFLTKDAAESWLARTEHAILTGGVAVRPDMTLAEYADIWHRRKERSWSPSTLHLRQSQWAQQIEPVLGPIELDQITRTDCQLLADDMAERHSPTYVRDVITALRSMLNGAIRDELISANPAAQLDLPRRRNHAIVTWTADEARRFLVAATGTETETLARLLLSTGMRIGEALALTWPHVDLDGGMVRVAATLRFGVTGQVERADAPKTEASRRSIPISARMVETLARHRGHQEEWLDDRGVANADQLVFLNPFASHVHPSMARRRLYSVMDAAGVPRLSPHGLRHTAATLMMEQGIHPLVVSRLLGHSGVAMTLDTYTHPATGIHRDAVDRLDSVIDSDGVASDAKSGQFEGECVTNVSPLDE